MARSQASKDSGDGKDSAVEVVESSGEENVSVSNKSPTMPSSMEHSPGAQSPPKFWIELPPLPEDYADYKLMDFPRPKRAKDDASDGEDNSSRIPVAVVGEMMEKGEKFYYARVRGGIITRFTARSVQVKYPQLVKRYKRKLKDGTLSDFDPSSTAVHPKHRVKLRLNLFEPRKKATRSRSSRSSTYLSDQTEFVTVSSTSEDEVVPVRQSSRLAANANNQAFNTRKVRDLRRNNRAGSSASVTEVDSGSEYAVESAAESDKKRLPPVRLKRDRRPRKPIQGLGVVRSVDEDADSDGEVDTAILLSHRGYCEGCGEEPAHKSLEKLKKRKGKKKSRPKLNLEDEESEPEDERLENLGGWIRCLHCCVVGHWGCLSLAQKQEILLAAKRHDNEVEKAEMRARGLEVDDNAELVEKRTQIWLDETTEFVCGLCSKGGRCIICREETTPQQPRAVAPSMGSSAADAIDLDTPPPESSTQIVVTNPSPNKDGPTPTSPKSPAKPLEVVKPNEVHSHYAPPNIPQVLFRCKTCRRPAHWQHLPPRDPSDNNQRTAVQIASVYLERGPDQWKCPDCVRLRYPAESILAWRPDPPDAVENLPPGEIPKPKNLLPREYLVKFKERGYKRVEWVSHMWLLAMHESLLRHFLKNGTRLSLLEDDSKEFQEKIGKNQGDDKGSAGVATGGGALDVLPVFARSRSVSAEVDKKEPEYEETPGPVPDAQLRIPNSWLRIDRVLDVILRLPSDAKKRGRTKGKARRKAIRIRDSEDELESDSEGEQEPDDPVFVDGEEPSGELTETVEDFELREGRKPKAKEIIDNAVWIYFKFEDLQYDECAWDSPPKPNTLEWDSYEKAVSRYVFAQSVEVPKLTAKEEAMRDNRPKRDISAWSGEDLQPKLEDKSLQLMPFQLQGLQWLYGNWWNLQPSILADDMGLGKTVQLVSLIGKLVTKRVFPHLIVVPNSTIVNWIREFERWTPHVRVVRYNGEVKARQVIKKTELWNSDGKQMYHALVTTYETLIGADFHQIFKKPGRWETVVVDEGQRLKSDTNLLFKKLNELKTIHRILMTGTPLNNNIRELFNLMNFLDSSNWNNLRELEEEYDQENLTEELIGQLHERLRPYFLRRQKAEVLDLPDKHEVIVPVSLAPIQKDIMRAILEANLQTLGLLADKGTRESNKVARPKKTALHNALMEMRKCIQHPYLNQPDMERRGLSQEETLKQLVDASAKFRLLKIMLPQLKKRGHRVLLFSQFKIVLDIVEDFLVMEGYKLLRLDGNTKSSLRQKDIDEFNKPGSDYFIYILTTRAGGVGVNLGSADTVIIFDPDFNPHQDLQAIARAHRYGQKQRVLVFKFMAKDSPEEKIFMMGKKKLVLDHLIIQKLDDEDEMEDIKGILTYGAKALFENPRESVLDIKYTEKDVEELIARAETEKIEEKTTEAGMKFDFAQVWDRGQGTKDLEEGKQDAAAEDDFWAGVLKRAAEEREKKRAQELTGRGARKRAVTNYREGDFGEDSPKKPPRSEGSKDKGVDDEFRPAGEESSSSSDEGIGSSASDGLPLMLSDPPDHGAFAHRSDGAIPTAYGHLPPPVQWMPNYSIMGQSPALQSPVIPPPPPKTKKRKPKEHPPASDQVTHNAPSGSGPAGVESNAKGKKPTPSFGYQYFCPHCKRMHSGGGCPNSGDIDQLLSTHWAILSPDNVDMDDHKYWALTHIERKLAALGFNVSQLSKPALHPEPVAKPKPKPKSKLKKPQPFPQDGLATSGPGPSTLAAGTSNQANPPPTKKPKPKPIAAVPGSSTTTIPFLNAPSQPFHGLPASGSGHPAPIPPPVAKPTNFATSTADALNAASRASASGTPHLGLSTNAWPQGTTIAKAPMPITQPQIVPRAVSDAVRTVQPKPSPRVASVAIPSTTPITLAVPLPNQTSAPSSAGSSASGAKRPAGNEHEEVRKKRKVGVCLICGERPGHLAHECPSVQSIKGLQSAIVKLEATSQADVAQLPILGALRRMLARRTGEPKE